MGLPSPRTLLPNTARFKFSSQITSKEPAGDVLPVVQYPLSRIDLKSCEKAQTNKMGGILESNRFIGDL
jgi:hypothetical protein